MHPPLLPKAMLDIPKTRMLRQPIRDVSRQAIPQLGRPSQAQPHEIRKRHVDEGGAHGHALDLIQLHELVWLRRGLDAEEAEVSRAPAGVADQDDVVDGEAHKGFFQRVDARRFSFCEAQIYSVVRRVVAPEAGQWESVPEGFHYRVGRPCRRHAEQEKNLLLVPAEADLRLYALLDMVIHLLQIQDHQSLRFRHRLRDVFEAVLLRIVDGLLVEEDLPPFEELGGRLAGHHVHLVAPGFDGVGVGLEDHLGGDFFAVVVDGAGPVGDDLGSWGCEVRPCDACG